MKFLIQKFHDIIHQIKNFSKYLSYKNLNSFNTDLNLIYKAVNEEIALI